ncbi:hypothetical protein [Vibrio owensii]|uniref:hypothetical protein n=1 Tax=Vibrio owensii TaxID=696485 RepID=UPI003CC5917A
MSPKLNTPYIIVTANDIKEHSDQVIKMIGSRLNVGCKTSNALDIATAGVGIKDFKTFKGLAKKKHYTVKANMGTQHQPFYTEHNIGFFDNASQASEAADEVLKNCTSFLEWLLLENGYSTDFIKRTPLSEKGLCAQIEVYGNTQSDLELGLEKVCEQINSGLMSGCDSNADSSYSFEIEGEELEMPVFDLLDTPYMAIIDNDGFLACTQENTSVCPRITYTAGHNSTISEFRLAGRADAAIEEWFGDLMLIERVSLDDEEDSVELIAVDHEGVLVHQLPKDELEEVLNKDKTQERLFIFKVLEFTR